VYRTTTTFLRSLNAFFSLKDVAKAAESTYSLFCARITAAITYANNQFIIIELYIRKGDTITSK